VENKAFQKSQHFASCKTLAAILKKTLKKSQLIPFFGIYHKKYNYG
jgi:hypothetical protein